MTYRYLGLKKISRAMELSASDTAIKEFDAVPVALWLIATGAQYRHCRIAMQFSTQAQAFLSEYEMQALQALNNLSAPAQLMMEAVLLACEMPARGDLDKNLSLIAATYAHAQKVSLIPVPAVKVKYSIKKQRDTVFTKLMTVRSDVILELGFEATSLVLAALKNAVGRDLGVKISISNAYDIFGDAMYQTRRAPSYPDIDAFLMRTLVVDHLCKNLTLPYVKDNIGGIKVISDYFESISIRS